MLLISKMPRNHFSSDCQAERNTRIAQAFAKYDRYQVQLTDISPELAEKGKERIAKQLSGLESKGKISHEETVSMLSRIETGTKDICGNCDLGSLSR